MTDTAQEQERVERYFLRYMSHRRTCRYGRDTPDGDYCTCGLAIAKQALRNRLRARQREGEREGDDERPNVPYERQVP